MFSDSEMVVTDKQKILAAEFALDGGKLTLEFAKEWLGIDHADSDDLLRLLIASFDLNEDKSRWNL
jgi:hypothetical protein